MNVFLRFLLRLQLPFLLIKPSIYCAYHLPRKFRLDTEAGEELELSSGGAPGERLVQRNSIAICRDYPPLLSFKGKEPHIRSADLRPNTFAVIWTYSLEPRFN